MLSINKVHVIGWLGDDPEVKTVGEGTQLTRLRLATSRNYKGEDFTEWHTIVVWGDQQAEFASKYLQKGSHVSVEGRLQTRQWETQSGEKRYSTEIVGWRIDAVGKVEMVDDSDRSHLSDPEAPADSGPTEEQTEFPAEEKTEETVMLGGVKFEKADDLPF